MKPLFIAIILMFILVRVGEGLNYETGEVPSEGYCGLRGCNTWHNDSARGIWEHEDFCVGAGGTHTCYSYRYTDEDKERAWRKTQYKKAMDKMVTNSGNLQKELNNLKAEIEELRKAIQLICNHRVNMLDQNPCPMCGRYSN